LSKALIAEKALEAAEQSHILELESAKAELRAELDQARSKISEVKGRKSVLKSNYVNLRNDYKNLEAIKNVLQWEKAEAEKTRDAEVAQSHNKFLKFHVHFHTRLSEIHKEMKKSLGKLGGRCLDYLKMGGMIGGIIDWFMGEI
jgi:chromosome segregation ATPase